MQIKIRIERGAPGNKIFIELFEGYIADMPMNNQLPTPNFERDPPNCLAGKNCLAGLRPWRKNSYRLENKQISGKSAYHNYGHGGAGITLRWGCAYEIFDLIREDVPDRSDSIAILGAGVMGLTAAQALTDGGYNVTIYAEHAPLETTSAVAGGQWAPSVVAIGNKIEFERILRRSHAAFVNQLGG